MANRREEREERIHYDPNSDPLLGRLVKLFLSTGRGRRREWLHGVVGFSFNKLTKHGNTFKEVPTGKYQIMWGKFMRYVEAQKVKLEQQNWSSHLPKNGYPLLRMKKEGRLVYTDTKQPGTLNLTEQQGKQQERHVRNSMEHRRAGKRQSKGGGGARRSTSSIDGGRLDWWGCPNDGRYRRDVYGGDRRNQRGD